MIPPVRFGRTEGYAAWRHNPFFIIQPGNSIFIAQRNEERHRGSFAPFPSLSFRAILRASRRRSGDAESTRRRDSVSCDFAQDDTHAGPRRMTFPYMTQGCQISTFPLCHFDRREKRFSLGGSAEQSASLGVWRSLFAALIGMTGKKCPSSCAGGMPAVPWPTRCPWFSGTARRAPTAPYLCPFGGRQGGKSSDAIGVALAMEGFRVGAQRSRGMTFPVYDVSSRIECLYDAMRQTAMAGEGWAGGQKKRKK